MYAATMPHSVPTVAPVAEIERRLHWRVLGIAGFLLLILILAVMAAVSVLIPARLVAGLPDDPEVTTATALLHSRLPMRAGVLRFRSALTGEAPPGAVFDAEAERLIERAARSLARARARHRGDPRLAVALAHLDLARQRYALAEHRYRAVTDRGVDSPEARLGLGVALARQADAERDALRARALRLEALAQLVAVDPRDAAFEPALYDRALLLAAIGRRAEALRVAGKYAARDSVSPWTERLRRGLADVGD
jgi:tetratricopeptide (TPR) repeat protein